MRVYYLQLTKSNFALTNSNQWQSTVIDLYDNGSYKNYSTIKSFYGQEATPGNWDSNKKYLWTGFSQSPININSSDTSKNAYGKSGIIESQQSGALGGNRFIDCSGFINIIGYSLVTSFSYTGNQDVDLYFSNDPTLYLDEWSESTGYTQSGGINLNDVDRYLIVNLNFDLYPGNDAAIYLRIEVGPPVMAPKYQVTSEILNRFPEWMAIREYDQEVLQATPQLAMPTSLGGALINAVSGEWIEELKLAIRDQSTNAFVDTVDLTQMAWCYKTTGAPTYVYSIFGDGVQLGLAYDESEFNEATDTEYIAWWDESNQVIYSNLLFTNFSINGVQYPQVISQVWNSFDELGLEVDLKRISGETNDNYQKRIYDVFKNPLGAGFESFKNAIRRELNMWSLYGSTPDSNFVGATPDVIEMVDIENSAEFVLPNGLPTNKFITLVDKLAKQYPTTWGYLKWDKMLWDMSGTTYDGYSVLPKSYDATPLDASYIQSGVGGGDDILVLRPNDVTGPHTFIAELTLRGKQKFTQETYPPVVLDLEVQGRALRNNYNNPMISSYFTVEIVLNDGTNITWVSSFSISNSNTQKSDTENWFDGSPTAQEIIGANGIVNPNFKFKNKYINNVEPDYLNQLIDISNILTLEIKVGKWNTTSRGYSGYPEFDAFRAWLSNDISIYAANSNLIGGPTTDPAYTGNPAHILYNASPHTLGLELPLSELSSLPRVSLLMLSTQVNSTSEYWYSETNTTSVSINGGVDITTPLNTILYAPEVNWDPNVISNSKKYIYTVKSTSGTSIPTPVATVTPYNQDPYIVDLSYVAVTEYNSDINGSNVVPTGDVIWQDGSLEISVFDTINANYFNHLVFSINSGYIEYPLYPVVEYHWIPFVSTPYQLTATVDENGPWVNGFAPPLGEGISDILATLNLSRLNFAITKFMWNNYMINWIGVTTNDPQVVAWLDTNTIVPLLQDGVDVTYPNNSITEYEFNGNIVYSPIKVHAKLLPEHPQWYPQINSGTFFEGEKEYYLYSEPSTETMGGDGLLRGLSRQGAPIIVRTDEATPTYMRQVAFFNDDLAPDMNTPTVLSLSNTEKIMGTGYNYLYVAYNDIYNISIQDITYSTQITNISLLSSSSINNIVYTQDITDPTHTYSVVYTVRNSFFADHQYMDPYGNLHTYLAFDATPAYPVKYVIDYETSTFDSVTSVSIPLNPLYSNMDEGFLFISHEEYPLSNIIVEANPKTFSANGRDYIYITINSVDTYGNPKPYQSVTLGSTYGSFTFNNPFNATQIITTDENGYASTALFSAATPPSGSIDPVSFLHEGSITIEADMISTTFPFTVQPKVLLKNSIYAIASQDTMPADGLSYNVVRGKVLDAQSNPVPSATVGYIKARSNYELFATTTNSTGTCTTDADGVFQIGPFNSDTTPGYWFLAVSTNDGISVNDVGDVVYWYEYSPSIYGVEDMTGLPKAPIQDTRPIGTIPPYAYGDFYPVSYTERVTNYANPYVEPVIEPYSGPISATKLPYPVPYVNINVATPIIHWVPPTWYALPLYEQFQMGLLYLGQRHNTGGDL